MSENSPIIEFIDVNYAYPGQQPVLNHFDFSLARGEKIGIIAPNGSGKTTLLHLIVGLIKPDAGRINLFGKPAVTEKDFVAIRKRIGLLFQDVDDQLFSPTVLEDVAFGPLNLGKSKEEAIEISRKTLAFLGLADFESRITLKLSGGEKRLVALATVLSMNPEVILLDEPTAGLDDKTKSRLTEILKSLDVSAIVVSHEFEFVQDTTQVIRSIKDGRMLLDNEFYVHSHVHSHPYGSQEHHH